MTAEKTMATLLPLEVRLQLVAASKIKNELQRRVAIEQAQDTARARHPDLFQPIPVAEAAPCA